MSGNKQLLAYRSDHKKCLIITLRGKQTNQIRELHELFIEKLRKSLERASMCCGIIHTRYPRVFTDN